MITALPRHSTVVHFEMLTCAIAASTPCHLSVSFSKTTTFDESSASEDFAGPKAAISLMFSKKSQKNLTIRATLR